MNDKQLLDAVKLAAGVPADGWGVTWNPLYNPGHCNELIVSKRVRIEWTKVVVYARAERGIIDKSEEFSGPASAPAAMRRAVCRAVVGGAA